MFFWCLCCVCPCRDSGDCLVLVLSLLHWLSTIVSGWLAMVSKLRRGVRGSRVKSVQKESWRVRSQLMEERSGRVNSAQNRMCGRDGVAGAATITFRQGCVGSTGRRLPQGLENGLRALRRRAGRKKGETKALRQKMRSFGPGLRPWKRKESEGVQGGQGLPSRRESGLEEEWDEHMKKLQKELRDIEKFSCIPKEFQERLESK